MAADRSQEHWEGMSNNAHDGQGRGYTSEAARQVGLCPNNGCRPIQRRIAKNHTSSQLDLATLAQCAQQ
jgi:hypothetical protein